MKRHDATAVSNAALCWHTCLRAARYRHLSTYLPRWRMTNMTTVQGQTGLVACGKRQAVDGSTLTEPSSRSGMARQHGELCKTRRSAARRPPLPILGRGMAACLRAGMDACWQKLTSLIYWRHAAADIASLAVAKRLTTAALWLERRRHVRLYRPADISVKSSRPETNPTPSRHPYTCEEITAHRWAKHSQTTVAWRVANAAAHRHARAGARTRWRGGARGPRERRRRWTGDGVAWRGYTA